MNLRVTEVYRIDTLIVAGPPLEACRAEVEAMVEGRRDAIEAVG